jgi:hypothetical protein
LNSTLDSRVQYKQDRVSYSYRAYGVGIDSNSTIAGLDPCVHDTQRVILRFDSGPEPDWVRRGRQSPGHVFSRVPESADPSFVLTRHTDPHCYELSYSDGACFVVNDTGERVWGTFQPPLTSDDLATYFLGPVMGFLLRRRLITCLHASAVELGGRAVVFSGDAGYGKSTTAAALALRGAPVITEDIVPLELAKSCCWAVPGYPRVCLWPDAVAKLTGDPESLPKLTPVWDKRYLPLDGVRAKFAEEKKSLGLIYLFGERSPAKNAPRIEEMSPKDALFELVESTYMNWVLDREQRAKEFEDLSHVVKEVPVRKIVAHTDGEKIGTLCELIQADAAKVLGHS